MSDFISASCPGCGNKLGRREMDKLTSIVGFRSRVTCGQCGATMRWNHEARKKLKCIAYLWLVAPAMMSLGILSSYDLVPFLAQYNSLFLLLGVLLNIGCLYLARHLAQSYTLVQDVVQDKGSK